MSRDHPDLYNVGSADNLQREKLDKAKDMENEICHSTKDRNRYTLLQWAYKGLLDDHITRPVLISFAGHLVTCKVGLESNRSAVGDRSSGNNVFQLGLLQHGNTFCHRACEEDLGVETTCKVAQDGGKAVELGVNSQEDARSCRCVVVVYEN